MAESAALPVFFVILSCPYSQLCSHIFIPNDNVICFTFENVKRMKDEFPNFVDKAQNVRFCLSVFG